MPRNSRRERASWRLSETVSPELERSVIVTELAPRVCETSSRLYWKLKYFRVRLSLARTARVVRAAVGRRAVVRRVVRVERELERAIVLSFSAPVAGPLVKTLYHNYERS